MVGQAIGQVIAFAAGVALSPTAVIGVVLLLSTARARSVGPAFMLGWMLGLATVGTVALAAASGAEASEAGAPATWVSVLKIVLGMLLLLVAVRQWRGRHPGDGEAKLPAWMQAIDKFTWPRAAGVAVALAALNPKNLLLTVSAAAAIAQTGADTGAQAVALAVFVLLGSLGVGVPLAIYFLMGDRATTVLGGLRGWMVRENATIVSVICVIIGAKLIGDAITALAS
jgi:threonine/homoserine/homoserine lactone efflux protein